MASYQYSKLQNTDIRLLDLQPGEFDDELSATIRPVTLSDSIDQADDKRLSLQELRGDTTARLER